MVVIVLQDGEEGTLLDVTFEPGLGDKPEDPTEAQIAAIRGVHFMATEVLGYEVPISTES